MAAWRFRKCPACYGVFAAGELRPAGRFRPGWQKGGGMERQCPICGHVAPTWKFKVVRERRVMA